MRRLPLWMVIAGILAAIAVYVWPTRYRYDRVNEEEGVSYPLRIDRFSGKTEIFIPERGWVDLAASQSNSAKQEDQALPLEEFQKLSGTANVYVSKLTIRLYNGSNWKVNEITVEFWTSNKQQGEIRRRYRIKNKYSAEPFRTTIFEAYLDSWPEAAQKWGWSLVEAKGSKQ